MDFATFFKSATGKSFPYDYQKHLAELPCESRLINVPTGLGKTAAVILSWVHNRVHLQDKNWPRRLAYCLPMRTLVEQTHLETKTWLQKHSLLWNGKEPHKGKVGLHILMGGNESPDHFEDWDLYPEENAILIGTQDMLLSRALNRGYGMSRYRWPMHFGLLNNDCLWVLDETQLMGVGVETSAQLDGFRHFTGWSQQSPCPTWWMSATLDNSRLATVDHPTPNGGWPRIKLQQADQEAVKDRLDAVKRLHRTELSLSKQLKPDAYAKDFAKLILKKHITGQLTLVIVNRVSRAQELYSALQKAGRKENLALIHSRFRSPDRKTHQNLLINGTGDRIVVATQAVEAGVDVTARVLVTELAPWTSLVQRLGRCNRGGEFNSEGADVYWINLDFDEEADVAPYTLIELQTARAELEKLVGHSVSPNALSTIKVVSQTVVRPVIRRKDLIDLFDTTPDIAGHDLDISRYIREGENTDVQVFWRDLSATNFTPIKDTKEPSRKELCSVAVWRFQAFIDKLKNGNDGRFSYIWDGLHGEWRKAATVRPGCVYLLDQRAGGYHVGLGWIDQPAEIKKEAEWTPIIAVEGEKTPDATLWDPLTMIGRPLILSEHTRHVVLELEIILDKLLSFSEWREPLLTAASWHDVGKSHPDFQHMLRDVAGNTLPQGILAKSGGKSGSFPHGWRKHFRHELASALAWLANHDGSEKADLIAYIIASHHGKVRLSIRSMPEEAPPTEQADTLIARGILDGDKLPELELEGLSIPETTLRLDLMRMGSNDQGRPSWLARMIALRDHLGPFTLAYLETLLRAADMRASAAEAKTPS